MPPPSPAALPWLPSREYAERGGARFHLVYATRHDLPPPPPFLGTLRVDMLRYLEPDTPDLGVLELSEPLVFGTHGWIVGADGILLPEQSWYGRDVGRMPLPGRWPAGTRLPGTSLTLASDFAHRSYGHYLLDSLPRLHLFRAAGCTLDEVDHVLCHRPPTAEAERHFARLGVPPDKCRWLAEGEAWRPDRLLAPSYPGTRRKIPGWASGFLRDRCGTAPPSRGRRLWIGRTGRRSLVNAAEVEHAMRTLGFEVFDPAAADHPADDFAAATFIVSPHGGVLADLVFCAPDTKVLELVPTDHPAPYYYTLSLGAGLEYRALACRSLYERPEGMRSPSTSDVTVDVEELTGAIESMER